MGQGRKTYRKDIRKIGLKIVISGGRGGGISAVKTIREKNENIEITLISKEDVSYYSRGVLRYYIKGKILSEALFPRGWNFYKENKLISVFPKCRIIP